MDPVRIIEFGRPEWQTHLGGSFYGPEEAAGLAQNWAGEKPCWCILPGLGTDTDYMARLEAAPVAPYGAELQEVRLVAPGEKVLLHRVFPVDSDVFAAPFSPLQPNRIPVEFRWRRLPPPALYVQINNQPAATLSFRTRPDLQVHEFLLRRELLAENSVISFTPSFALSPAAYGNTAETRNVSFRFFRLLLFSLPS